MLARNTESLEYLSNEIPRNNPSLDSIMFIRHNVASWQEPPDIVFEPSPVWHDDANMVVDENATTFLRNLMGKSKAQLGELKSEVDKKRREVENVRRIRTTVREGKDKRDEIEIVTAILSSRRAASDRSQTSRAGSGDGDDQVCGGRCFSWGEKPQLQASDLQDSYQL